MHRLIFRIDMRSLFHHISFLMPFFFASCATKTDEQNMDDLKFFINKNGELVEIYAQPNKKEELLTKLRDVYEDEHKFRSFLKQKQGLLTFMFLPGYDYELEVHNSGGVLPNWKFAMHSKSYIMGTYTNKGFDAHDYFDKKSWEQLKLLYSDYNKDIDQRFYSD